MSVLVSASWNASFNQPTPDIPGTSVATSGKSFTCDGRLVTLSVPRTVAELDVSNNPLVSAEKDARASVFVRLHADDAYARHITDINLSRTGLRFVPPAVPTFRCLTSLQLANNRISVSLSLSLSLLTTLRFTVLEMRINLTR